MVGNPILGDEGVFDNTYDLTFTVNERPRVLSTAPANDASNVAPGTNISLTLNERVRVNRDGVRFSCQPGGIVRGRLSISGTTYTLNPVEDLPVLSVCTLAIPTSNVTDPQGLQLIDNDGNNDGILRLRFVTRGSAAAASTETDATELPELEIETLIEN